MVWEDLKDAAKYDDNQLDLHTQWQRGNMRRFKANTAWDGPMEGVFYDSSTIIICMFCVSALIMLRVRVCSFVLHMSIRLCLKERHTRRKSALLHILYVEKLCDKFRTHVEMRAAGNSR